MDQEIDEEDGIYVYFEKENLFAIYNEAQQKEFIMTEKPVQGAVRQWNKSSQIKPKRRTRSSASSALPTSGSSSLASKASSVPKERKTGKRRKQIRRDQEDRDSLESKRTALLDKQKIDLKHNEDALHTQGQDVRRSCIIIRRSRSCHKTTTSRTSSRTGYTIAQSVCTLITYFVMCSWPQEKGPTSTEQSF